MNNRNTVRLCALVAALIASMWLSCEKTTAILLIVDGDLSPGEDFNALEISIFVDGNEVANNTYRMSQEKTLPQTLEILPGDTANATISIRVKAVLNSREVLSIVRESSFVTESRVEERICLFNGCIGSADVLCSQGACTHHSSDGDADIDSDLDGDSDDDSDTETEPTGLPPGSLCSCDSDCLTIGKHEGFCLIGICMNRASAVCAGPGSTYECPEGSRCWGLDVFPDLGGICWPDCETYTNCEGSCDSDGSCAFTPMTAMSCDEECTEKCCFPDICYTRECGPDGCGGTCLPGCRTDERCDESSYTCVPCTPDCVGRECGSNGCSSTCPPGCDTGETCNETTGICE